MNISEIRKKAISLVLSGKYYIHWDHIIRRGHEISEFEIKMTLLHGRHAFDKDRSDRYAAFGYINEKNIRVVYEFVCVADGEVLLVVTAFAEESDWDDEEKGRISRD